MNRVILKSILAAMYLSVFWFGWEFGSLIKENKRLKAKGEEINLFCVNNKKFECNKQVWPNGKVMIVVTEKK